VAYQVKIEDIVNNDPIAPARSGRAMQRRSSPTERTEGLFIAFQERNG
jgi:hypothetical protein